MKIFDYWDFLTRTIYLKMQKNRALLMTLAVLVVFATTYMLILPALTLEKDKAADQGGITVAEQSTEEAEEASDQDEEPAESTKPSALELEFEGDKYTVNVSGDAAAKLPESTELTAEEITKAEYETAYKDYYKKALAAVREDAEAAQPEGADAKGKNLVASLKYAHFYDITLTEDGRELEPEAPVSLSIAFDKALKVADQDHLKILHFTEDPETGEPVTQILDPETIELQLKKEKMTSATFTAESFSVYGIVYTVDFHYDVDGETFEYSLEGGKSITLSELVKKLGIAKKSGLSAKEFIAGVQDVEFSNTKLVSVKKTDAEDSETSTQDWTLESKKPFKTTETLTITMKNGDVVTVEVTDYQEIPDTTFNSTDSYVIAYKDAQNKYHVLKADGSQTVIDSKDDIDYLDNNYKWKFSYVFEEKDPGHPNENNKYYFIRPISDLSKSIALNDVGENLVQNGANNIGVIPQDGGFYLEGHATNNEDVPNLYFDGSDFKARMYEQSLIQIFKPDDIKQYEFTIRTADPTMGLVTGKDKTGTPKTDVEEFVTRTKDNNNNNWKAEAKAKTDIKNGQNRYLFDYFDLNGTRVPSDKVEVNSAGTVGKIKDNSLQIPYNGSVLTAHFKLNPDYVGSSPVEDLSKWVEEIKSKNIPLDESATKKTAEVYDYENRIYRVDLSTKSSLNSFNGTVDLGLILDVSGSMKFPSKLVPSSDVSGEKNIWHINSEWQQWGLKTDKTYYVIAEKTTRATVFRIQYSTTDNSWHRIDASYNGIGDWIGSWDYGGHQYTKFGVDPEGTTYTIYESGDNDRNGEAVTRSYYEKQSIDNTAKTLNDILKVLNVSQNGNDSPTVRAAWNTFAYNIRSSHHGFVELNDHNSLDIDYATQGGTRTDTAMTDALSFDWGSSNTKYAILITDGAPQYSSDKSKNPDYPGVFIA